MDIPASDNHGLPDSSLGGGQTPRTQEPNPNLLRIKEPGLTVLGLQSKALLDKYNLKKESYKVEIILAQNLTSKRRILKW
jgi:hypothetical protein